MVGSLWCVGSRVRDIEGGAAAGFVRRVEAVWNGREARAKKRSRDNRERVLRKFSERCAVGTMASARTAPTAFGASRAGVAKEAGEVRTMVVGKEADDKRGGACFGIGRARGTVQTDFGK